MYILSEAHACVFVGMHGNACVSMGVCITDRLSVHVSECQACEGPG